MTATPKNRIDESGLGDKCGVLSLSPSIKSIFNAVLVLSVLFVYGLGSVAVIEVEHEHEDRSDQVASDHDHGHEHHHDSHDSGDEDSNDDTDGDSHSDSHRHSHFVSLDIPSAFGPAKVPTTNLVKCLIDRLDPESLICPDGPFYDLSKPPQLG